MTLALDSVQAAWSRKHQSGRGALIGGIVGVALGVAFGLFAHGFCEGESDDCGSAAGTGIVGGLTVGAVGAGLGALIGAAIPCLEAAGAAEVIRFAQHQTSISREEHMKRIISKLSAALCLSIIALGCGGDDGSRARGNHGGRMGLHWVQ